MSSMLGAGGEDRPTRWELDGIAADLAETLRRRDDLSLRAAALAGVLAENGYGGSDGELSTGEWLRHECRLNTQGAYDLVNVGLEMENLEASVRACAEHEIGFQHLAVIARTKRQLRGKPFPEAHLLGEAKEASVGRLWHRCQEIRHACDKERVEVEHRDAVERRALRVTRQMDGCVTLSGILDPAGGAAVQAALEPLARKAGLDDDRTLDRRMADALLELATIRMDQAAPRQGPHLNVTATVGTLWQEPGSAGATAGNGALLPAVTVTRIACDCSIGRYVFEGDSVLVVVGRDRRVVSASQRRAVIQRDRHCRWPGCERPAGWCEAHHVVHWIHGGPTNLDNLVLLCSRHHWMVHEGRWQLFVDERGTVRVLKPPLDLLAPPRGPDEAAA